MVTSSGREHVLATRALGGASAALIALGWWPVVVSFSAWAPLQIAFVSVVPIAGWLGWHLAPAIVDEKATLPAALDFAFRSVVANSFVLGLVFSVSDQHQMGLDLGGPVEISTRALLYGVPGVIVFGWAAAIPALLSAWTWTVVVRRVIGRATT